MTVLRYGNNSTVELEFTHGDPLGEFGVPTRQPLGNLVAATRAALDEPLEYPPLCRCTTPADHVVLAVEQGVPDVARVIAVVVQALIDADIDPDGITVLQSAPNPGVAAGEPCRMLPAVLRDRVTLLTHDPADRRQLAYLAANEAGEAILVNRAIHDADVVLPVGCLHAEEAVGYFGIHGSVFPAFSDTKTIQKFRGLGTLNGHGAHKRELAAEVDHVAWLLGLNFTIQLVPGPGGRALAVLAGQSDLVRQRGRSCIGTSGNAPLPTAPAWSWPRSKAMPLSRRGKTWPGRSMRLVAMLKKMVRSRCVASFRPVQGRPCDDWPTLPHDIPPCGTWARSGPPTHCRPHRSPAFLNSTNSIC